ncbi:hypothetical protein ACTSKR_09545 [Chitinibacteraceae bacterium HSL-7]
MAKAPPLNDRARSAAINVVLGASGSGKTTFVMRAIKRDKPRRLIVWDTKDEFAAEGYADRVPSVAELIKRIRAAGDIGPFKLAIRPDGSIAQLRAAFDLVAMAAYTAGHVTFVAEELSDMAQGGAIHSDGWRRCVVMGRTRGLTLYALSQRPALMDKTVIGNASLLRCGRVLVPADAKAIAGFFAAVAREPEKAIAAELISMPDLAFLSRQGNTFERGTMKF